MILVDADILTLYWMGHDKVCLRFEQASEIVSIPIVVRIQVLQGRFDSVLKAANREQLLTAVSRLESTQANLQSLTLVSVDDAAALEFERLRQNKKLKKIGRADLLIGCIALAQQATLVTRNTRHFGQFPALRIENWAD